MDASLNDSAVLKDQNLIGLANGAEPVGDDETCAAAEKSFESTLNSLFRGGVDGARGLIQDQ